MPDWFLFILLTLAVYRVSQLLVYDDGPFDLVFKFRDWAGVYDRNETGEAQSHFGKFFSCIYCVGFWLAFFATFVISVSTSSFVLWWLAIAGGQAFLEGRARNG